MLPVSDEILMPFNAVMEQKAVPQQLRSDYRKWLRYYLDFRAKYPPPNSKSDHVRLFIEKLRSKNQTQQQLEQAADVLSLFFMMQSRKRGIENEEKVFSKPIPLSISPLKGEKVYSSSLSMERNEGGDRSLTKAATPLRTGRQFDEMRFREKTNAPEWDHVVERLEAEITTRHYSRKTLIAYANWGRKFQNYLKDKPSRELSALDVKDYLTYLAVKCKMSSSTQNQAFNALLFLYRHILMRYLGTLIRDVHLTYLSLFPHPLIFNMKRFVTIIV